MSGSAVATDQLITARPRSERFIRRVLCITGERQKTDADAQRLFSVAMVVSGIRCLLSYVVLPFVAPAIGAATGIEPYFGIPVSIVALVFDVRGVRRFWLADHRYRWQMTFVYVAVMALVVSLLVTDLLRLAHS